ncbi:cilia- and flagella-associated protein 157 isoform X1 [Venturia canescens]|uniref:cilia- and flagella-associated protein 157 isoform X1 n=1 Tax=Venturia canescens TaxID=32260 RepID=UPI001C9D0354|nr:cilia- and flagella-associated protein 157 isoform X1 [Venturia canescens]
MPKKKKKGPDKEKKAKKKSILNERETVSYEQQISDNNKQLTRLRLRNEHLEAQVDTLKNKLKELEEDRSDVVAHLRRILQQRTEEAHELNDRLLAMEELRKDEQVAFKKKEDAMQLEYNTMETNLSAEVKLAAGKLSSLEDWRLARTDLMRKFEIQEEQMAEQEKRHKETLYKAEKSLVIGKAKMQKEMEERLNALAQNFRQATNLRIADATHRAVRENITLNLELDAMYKVCEELDVKMKEHSEKERNLRIHSSLFQSEARIAMNKLLVQNRLIDHLAEDHYSMSLLHGKICREKAHKATKDQIVRTLFDKSVDTQLRGRVLEQNIEIVKKKTEDMLKEWKENRWRVKKLAELLDTAKCYVDGIDQHLDIVGEEDTVGTSCCSYFENELHVLMKILEKQRIIEVPSIGDYSSIEAEDTDELSNISEGDALSAKIMQIGMECEDSMWKGESEESSALRILKHQDVPTDLNIPQCLLSDSHSSDVTSPKETETPRSIFSGDTA